MAVPTYRIETGIPLPKVRFPGGSKTRVSHAGEAIRKGTASREDFAVIDEWRAAHRQVLNTFQAILRTRTRDTDVVVAQRHKRRQTIFGKLQRFEKMELARMDDVAGCRLIFPNMDALSKFRSEVHAARFRHRLRNAVDKWDYIKSPKCTGYRGIHDVYEYDVNSAHGQAHKGLLLEVQYRTAPQHAWATCVEVVGFITHSQPKFQQGDKRYETIMAYASELIARSAEGMTSCLPDLSDLELVKSFLKLDEELGLLDLLRGLNATKNAISSRKNVILMFTEGEELQIFSYRGAKEALQALFALENSNPGKDIVLVKGDTSDDVRVAFRNYFSDATEFIALIDGACEKLGHMKMVPLSGMERMMASLKPDG